MSQFTKEQIGQRIKQRAGGKLDSFSDVDIADRVIQRNPDRFKGIIAQDAPKPATTDTGRGTVADLGVGAGKGALSTLKNTSSIGERLLSGTLQTLLPKSAERALGIENSPNLGILGKKRGEDQQTSAEKLQSQSEASLGLQQGQLTTPQNTAQKFGFGAEQIGEFFIPGGAVSKAGKGLQLATKAKTGTGLLSKGLGLAARAGVEGGAAALQTATQQGDVTDDTKGAFGLGAAFPVAGSLLGGLAKGFGKNLGKATTGFLGLSTGAKGSAIEEAFNNPNVRNYLREAGSDVNKIQDDVFDLAKVGLSKVKANRASAYRSQLEGIKQISTEFDDILRNTRQKASDLLTGIGAKTNVENVGRGKGGKLNQVDFSRTSLVEGENVVERAINTVAEWNDTSAVGLDKLKQRLQDLSEQLSAPGKSKAKRIVDELATEVRQGLKKNVDGYEVMTKGYQEASNLISELEKTLSLSDKRTRQQTMNKLMSVMRPGKEESAELVDELQKVLGQDLKGRIAAGNLAELQPRGLQGVIAPTAFGFGALTSLINPANIPTIMLYALLSSPRAAAEYVTLAGVASRQLKTSGKIAPDVQRGLKAILLEIQKSNQETLPPQ